MKKTSNTMRDIPSGYVQLPNGEYAKPRTARQMNADVCGEISVSVEGQGASCPDRESWRWPPRDSGLPQLGLSITIKGQVRGGKNNMIVTRTGHRFPRKAWAAWRDDAVKQVKAQLPQGWQPMQGEVDVVLEYVAGDRRRRDMPAIVDALWHVYEAAGIVLDDCQLWVVASSRSHKNNAGFVTATFTHNDQARRPEGQ